MPFNGDFQEPIIPELSGKNLVRWADAFKTSRATIEENQPPLPSLNYIYDNIEFMAREVLLPLTKKYDLDYTWINSWYRNDEVNRLVGGDPESNHKSGLAFDITVNQGINNRQLNEEIFAYIWNYFTQNNIKFDEIIWEVKDSGLKESGRGLQYPQWIHIAFKRDSSGKANGAKEVFSEGVKKDFQGYGLDDGYTNRGKTYFSSIQPNDLFSYMISVLRPNIALLRDESDSSFSRKAKYTLCLATLITMNGTQMDYLSTKSRTDYIEGGLVNFRGLGLYDIIKQGDSLTADRYYSSILNGDYNMINSFRNDKDMLNRISNILRSKKCLDYQILQIGNRLFETLLRAEALFIREPLCILYMLESYINDNTALDKFQGKSSLKGMTTDGSWLDYYVNISDIQLPTNINPKYRNLLKQYFEKR